MKKMIKRLLAALLLLCSLAALSGCSYLAVGASLLWHADKKHEGLEQYQKDAKDYEWVRELIPDPAGVSDAEDTVYHSRHIEFSMFVSDSHALFVTYPEELYAEKKAAVLSEYRFLDAPIIDNGLQIIPAAEFPYRTFQMKVTEGAEEWRACKKILMIGCDDAAHQIAYCLFYDIDLDFIAEAGKDGVTEMQRFMDENFYWLS